MSSAGVTGSEANEDSKEKYFAKLQSMNIQNPLLIGFGISTHKDYLLACKYAQGAIIGSAYIRQLEKGGRIDTTTSGFINSILHEST